MDSAYFRYLNYYIAIKKEGKKDQKDVHFL